ncbi:hypothetical protein [Spirochaeta dissipatitropha]
MRKCFIVFILFLFFVVACDSTGSNPGFVETRFTVSTPDEGQFTVEAFGPVDDLYDYPYEYNTQQIVSIDGVVRGVVATVALEKNPVRNITISRPDDTITVFDIVLPDLDLEAGVRLNDNEWTGFLFSGSYLHVRTRLAGGFDISIR